MMVALTLGLYRVVEHWALAVHSPVPLGVAIAGTTVYIIFAVTLTRVDSVFAGRAYAQCPARRRVKLKAPRATKRI